MCGDAGRFIAVLSTGREVVTPCMNPKCRAGQIEREKDADRLAGLYRDSGMTGPRSEATLDQFNHWPELVNAGLDLLHNRRVMVNGVPKVGFYLWGPNGVGKTHYASALVNEGYLMTPPVPGLFYNVLDLLMAFKSTYEDQSQMNFEQVFDRVINAPLLVLDDLYAQRDTAWSIEQLTHVITARTELGKPFIVTSNYDPVKMYDSFDNFDDLRIASRLLGALQVIHLGGPDLRLAA